MTTEQITSTLFTAAGIIACIALTYSIFKRRPVNSAEETVRNSSGFWGQDKKWAHALIFFMMPDGILYLISAIMAASAFIYKHLHS